MRFRWSVYLGCIFDRPLIVQTRHLVLGLKYMRAYRQLIYMTFQGQKKKEEEQIKSIRGSPDPVTMFAVPFRRGNDFAERVERVKT